MRRDLVAGVAAALAVIAGVTMAAQTAQPQAGGMWVGKSSKIPFTPMQLAGGRVTVDYPRRDWITVPTAGGTLLVMVQKDGNAWITVEHQKLQTALAPEDVTDLFAQLEADRLKAADPQASSMQTKLFNADNKRFTGVQYSRSGARGPEVVREYSFPVGSDLYRVTCGATMQQMPKVEPVFAHVAASFDAKADSTK